MINGGTCILESNVATVVLTDSSKMILKTDTFPLDPFKSQTLVIASQNEPTLSCNSIRRASSDVGNSRIDHGRIGTPIANKNIWSEDDNFRVKIDMDKAEKLDTSVQQSLTDESNTAPSRIEEGSLESIFPKIVEESNSSERMNLANFVLVQTPKLVSFRHPPMQTDNVGNPIDSIAATRVMDQDGIQKPTDRDVRTKPTHGDVETISKKLAYHKFIKDSEFETREVFERENIENIGTRLETTQIDKNQMTRSVDISNVAKSTNQK